MSNCQKDVKCQKVKHLDSARGSQKINRHNEVHTYWPQFWHQIWRSPKLVKNTFLAHFEGTQFWQQYLNGPGVTKNWHVSKLTKKGPRRCHKVSCVQIWQKNSNGKCPKLQKKEISTHYAIRWFKCKKVLYKFQNDIASELSTLSWSCKNLKLPHIFLISEVNSSPILMYEYSFWSLEAPLWESKLIFLLGGL